MTTTKCNKSFAYLEDLKKSKMEIKEYKENKSSGLGN